MDLAGDKPLLGEASLPKHKRIDFVCESDLHTIHPVFAKKKNREGTLSYSKSL